MSLSSAVAGFSRRSKRKDQGDYPRFHRYAPRFYGDEATWHYERALVRREILRFKEFAGLEEIKEIQAEAQLLDLQQAYGLFDI